MPVGTCLARAGRHSRSKKTAPQAKQRSSTCKNRKRLRNDIRAGLPGGFLVQNSLRIEPEPMAGVPRPQEIDLAVFYIVLFACQAIFLPGVSCPLGPRSLPVLWPSLGRPKTDLVRHDGVNKGVGGYVSCQGGASLPKQKNSPPGQTKKFHMQKPNKVTK